jgi:hypothetical protein
MKELLLGPAKIVVDETAAPVLEPGRGRTKTPSRGSQVV